MYEYLEMIVSMTMEVPLVCAECKCNIEIIVMIMMIDVPSTTR